MAIDDEILRAHSALKKIFRNVTTSINQALFRVYVSGLGATCFFGLAFVFGASLRTGAAFAATFLRSK